MPEVARYWNPELEEWRALLASDPVLHVGPEAPTGPEELWSDTDEDIPTGGGGGAASWDDLAGKPTTFPPSAHTHALDDVDGLTTALDGKVDDTDPRLSDARTPTAHTHDDRYYTEAEVDAKIAAALAEQLADLAYDSGELDITSLAGSRVTGGKFLLRRLGSLVTFSVVGVAPSSTLGSGSTVLTLPSGFRRPSRWDGYIQAGVSTFRSVFILDGGGLGVWAHQTSDSWRIELSWITDDPTPASLPGDPT